MSVLELNGRIFDASTTGTLTLTGEGGAATTDVTQGLAKHWILHQTKDANTIHDSFNTSSVTDETTGVFEPNFTSAMASTNYLIIGGVNSGVFNGSTMNPSNADNAYETETTKYEICIRGVGGNVGTLYDCFRSPTAVHGDLA